MTRTASASRRAPFAALLIVGLLAMGCGSTSGEDGPEISSGNPVSTHDPHIIAQTPDPCEDREEGSCTPLAALDLDGSGVPSGIAYETNPKGRVSLRIRTPETRTMFPIDGGPFAEKAPFDESRVAVVDLDGTPGHEIVAELGTLDNGIRRFHVLTMTDGEFVLVDAPQQLTDGAVGPGTWVFRPEDRHQVRCSADGEPQVSVSDSEVAQPFDCDDVRLSTWTG